MRYAPRASVGWRPHVPAPATNTPGNGSPVASCVATPSTAHWPYAASATNASKVTKALDVRNGTLDRRTPSRRPKPPRRGPSPLNSERQARSDGHRPTEDVVEQRRRIELVHTRAPQDLRRRARLLVEQVVDVAEDLPRIVAAEREAHAEIGVVRRRDRVVVDRRVRRRQPQLRDQRAVAFDQEAVELAAADVALLREH